MLRRTSTPKLPRRMSRYSPQTNGERAFLATMVVLVLLASCNIVLATLSYVFAPMSSMVPKWGLAVSFVSMAAAAMCLPCCGYYAVIERDRDFEGCFGCCGVTTFLGVVIAIVFFVSLVSTNGGVWPEYDVVPGAMLNSTSTPSVFGLCVNGYMDELAYRKVNMEITEVPTRCVDYVNTLIGNVVIHVIVVVVLLVSMCLIVSIFRGSEHKDAAPKNENTPANDLESQSTSLQMRGSTIPHMTQHTAFSSGHPTVVHMVNGQYPVPAAVAVVDCEVVQCV